MTTKSIASQALKASLFILVVFVPSAAARAAVVINEVAWMGTEATGGSSCEWVELLNNGAEPVSLSGWTLTVANEGAAPKSIGLSGSIGASGYYVLARNTASCLAAEPTKSAHLQISFGSGISNTATTLTLSNGSETLDTLDASGGWDDIGGLNGSDNKLPAQRHAGSWITAAATPGTANATEDYTPPAQEDDTSTDSSSKSTTTSNPGYVAAPLPQLFANAGGDRTVIVGADTKFVATAYDRDKRVINYAKFFWNFGDGSSAEGPWVMHHFSYPGTYAVQLTIVNTSLRTTSRITVTAHPASVELMLLPQGGVAVQNRSGRDLDLSFWVIKQGDSSFTLPEHSVVLKDASINIAQSTLGFAATNAKLYYPDGTEVAYAAPTAEPVAAPAVILPESNAPAQESTPSTQVVVPYVEEQDVEPIVAATSSAVQEQDPAALAASVAASKATLPLWTALAGLGGIVGLGVASVLAVRRKPVTGAGAEEFTIG